MTALLDVDALSVTYGGLQANDRVSLRVQRGQVVGLIGPNGAGKTTFVDAIAGVTPISSGTITFDGEQIHGLPAYRRARLGMARSFQSVQLFNDLTIAENLQVAAERVGWTAALDLIRPSRAAKDDALWALEFLGLIGVQRRLPGELSHGQRRLADVARALARRPSLVLLDEPAAGLDRNESRELGLRIREMLDRDVTVLLIDHDMGLVLQACDYIYVLEFGEIIAGGTPAEIRTNPRVIEAYLGGDREATADGPVP